MTLPELQARLHTVRSQYRVTPWIQPREDEAPLLRSWQRCVDAGMREGERVNFELVSKSWLAELDDRHGDFVRRSRGETQRLAQALRGTGAAVLLYDVRGVTIDRLCHEPSLPAPLRVASRVGVNLSERCVGTTAPAIALADGLPYLVGRDAHYFANTRPFFCVAAPIDDPQGRRMGALDITNYDSVPDFDVMSLVVDAAAAIENSLFQPGPDRVLVHFHPRAELVGTALEGLLMVDDTGRVCGANRAASRLLCLPRAALLDRAFGTLFDRRVPHLFGRSARQGSGLVEMLTPAGLQVAARFEGQPVEALPAAEVEAAPADRAPGRLPDVGAEATAGSMRELELRTIERTLAALDGNVSAAARRLCISRNTIYRRMQGRV